MQTIDRQIEAAQQQGNRAVEAMLRGQKAAGYTLQSNWHLAAAELEKAAALAETAGCPYNQYQLLAPAKSWPTCPARQPGKHDLVMAPDSSAKRARQRSRTSPAEPRPGLLSQPPDDALATIDEAGLPGPNRS
ncbi:MAG: hypothetical protein H6651_15550 [Ardenticatenales bacterium]|nr:hypothetical protein [Ardenticatenales bacterium]